MSGYVGQLLRQTRESKELSLQKVSRDTFIRVHYLKALEAGDLETLPSEAQARGFFRSYANYLGIKPEQVEVALLHGSGSSADIEFGMHAGEERNQVEDPEDLGFAEIGEKLRQQRELLGLTLEDVEQQTHLRIHYLEALESGDLGGLPSTVQGRGMLKNYSEFLGVDPNPLLLKFAEGLQARLAARKKEGSPAPSRKGLQIPSGLRRILSGDLVFGGVLMIALLTFVIWGAIRIASVQAEQQPAATAPSIAEVLIPSAAASPSVFSTQTPTVEIVAADEEQPPAGEIEEGLEITTTLEAEIPVTDDPIQVYIVARQRAWMQVVVDGEEEFVGRVIPGSAYPFSGREQVELLTGSGSAIQVLYNQQDLGPLGLFGEVVHRIFTADRVLTPTPTITPTPIATEPGLDSPTPSPTPEMISTSQITPSP